MIRDLVEFVLLALVGSPVIAFHYNPFESLIVWLAFLATAGGIALLATRRHSNASGS